MRRTCEVILTSISFDDFVSLIFNPAKQIQPDTQLSGIEEESDAKKLCAYYIQLFQKPEFLLLRFTKQELEQGFWEIMGYTHDWSLGLRVNQELRPILAMLGSALG